MELTMGMNAVEGGRRRKSSAGATVKALAVGWIASGVTCVMLWLVGVPYGVVIGGFVAACAYWYGVSVGARGMYAKGYERGMDDGIARMLV